MRYPIRLGALQVGVVFRRAVAGWAIAAAVVGAAGCAQEPSVTAEAEPARSGAAGEPVRVREGMPESVPDFQSPPVVAADAGLDVASLSTGPVGVSSAEFGSILEPYLSNMVPAEAQDLETWRTNGLRVVRVPLTDWPRLAGALGLSPAAQRQWLPADGAWTELVRGADEPRGQVVALDSERLELAAGALRLLGRCWQTPVPKGPDTPGAGAELYIELLPQLLESRRARTGPSLRIEDRLASALERGMPFPRLKLALRVRADEGDPQAASVLLVTAERPEADWRKPPPSAEGEAPPEPRGTPGVGEVVRGTHADPVGSHVRVLRRSEPNPSTTDLGAGPRAPLVRTVGEAIFRAPLPVADRATPQAGPAPSPRAILVLAPRVPGNFNLVPTLAQPPTGTGGSNGRNTRR